MEKTKVIKSKIQPDPRKCDIWIDLAEDPNGGILKKYNNVTKQYKPLTGDNTMLNDMISNNEYLENRIKELLTMISELNNKYSILYNVINGIEADLDNINIRLVELENQQ